jgi:hypothetical protein
VAVGVGVRLLQPEQAPEPEPQLARWFRFVPEQRRALLPVVRCSRFGPESGRRLERGQARCCRPPVLLCTRPAPGSEITRSMRLLISSESSFVSSQGLLSLPTLYETLHGVQALLQALRWNLLKLPNHTKDADANLFADAKPVPVSTEGFRNKPTRLVGNERGSCRQYGILTRAFKARRRTTAERHTPTGPQSVSRDIGGLVETSRNFSCDGQTNRSSYWKQSDSPPTAEVVIPGGN